jgi:hypothetical protein
VAGKADDMKERDGGGGRHLTEVSNRRHDEA